MRSFKASGVSAPHYVFISFLQLFDFDREVQPLLEVLVGKVVEQSLKEVMEEEELASLKAQQQAFDELRNYQLAEVQRLQEHERRRREEKVARSFILLLNLNTLHSLSMAAFRSTGLPNRGRC